MLKKAILNFKTKKNIKRRPEQVMMDFQSSERFGIIYSDDFENEESIREIVKDLKDMGKKVNMMVFCHQIKNKATALPHYSDYDISFKGEIKGGELDEFLKQSYDFALCFDQSGHFLIDYVFSSINAKCRVGIQSPDRIGLFEMMIQSGKENTSLSSEVMRYLKMVQNYGY